MHADIAERLRKAELDNLPIPPFAAEMQIDDIDTAYTIQKHNIASRAESGRKIVGRKIGLTSAAAQTQLGIDQPIHGPLFADRKILNGDKLEAARMISPILEGEIALVLDRDINDSDISFEEFSKAIRYVVPAIEIGDCRIENWKVSLPDLIADDCAASRFVLGESPKQLSDIDLSTCEMTLSRNNEIVSSGSGKDCLGNPLNSGYWLARYLLTQGDMLKAGDVVLTGALGPMVPANAGDRIECAITGFEPVTVEFL